MVGGVWGVGEGVGWGGGGANNVLVYLRSYNYVLDPLLISFNLRNPRFDAR